MNFLVVTALCMLDNPQPYIRAKFSPGGGFLQMRNKSVPSFGGGKETLGPWNRGWQGSAICYWVQIPLKAFSCKLSWCQCETHGQFSFKGVLVQFCYQLTNSGFVPHCMATLLFFFISLSAKPHFCDLEGAAFLISSKATTAFEVGEKQLDQGYKGVEWKCHLVHNSGTNTLLEN